MSAEAVKARSSSKFSILRRYLYDSNNSKAEISTPSQLALDIRDAALLATQTYCKSVSLASGLGSVMIPRRQYFLLLFGFLIQSNLLSWYVFSSSGILLAKRIDLQ